MATFQERLNEAMAIRNVKAVDISEATGISKARISQYVNGVYIPKSKATYAIAKALNVSEAWLMGLDVPMESAPQTGSREFIIKDILDEKILEMFMQLGDSERREVLGLIVEKFYNRLTQSSSRVSDQSEAISKQEGDLPPDDDDEGDEILIAARNSGEPRNMKMKKRKDVSILDKPDYDGGRK